MSIIAELIIGVIGILLFISIVTIGIYIIGIIVALVGIILVFAGIIWLYRNGWKKTFISIIVVSFILTGISVGVPLWNIYQYRHSIEGIIQEKEGRLRTMNQELERQLTNISQIQAKYQSDIKKFLGEISDEKQKFNITSITSATERVRYNVELIRERDAGLSKLAEIQKITANGHEETIYMLRQLDGAKGMAKIMVDGNSLANNAEIILRKYNSYGLENLVINRNELTFKSAEVIWQQYVR